MGKELQESHDTVTVLALDNMGDISGACSTGGLALKMHGRVGDSPIIGSGLYVDNEVGACGATGVGEIIMKCCSSFLVVELMRNGLSPKDACKTAIERIVKKYKLGEQKNLFGGDPIFSKIFGVKPDVALIALNKKGEIGAYSVFKGFQYSFFQNSKTTLLDSDYMLLK